MFDHRQRQASSLLVKCRNSLRSFNLNFQYLSLYQLSHAVCVLKKKLVEMKVVVALALVLCCLVAGSYSISCDKLCSRMQSLFPNKDVFSGCHSTCTTMFSADELSDEESGEMSEEMSEEMSSYSNGERLCVAAGSVCEIIFLSQNVLTCL